MRVLLLALAVTALVGAKAPSSGPLLLDDRKLDPALVLPPPPVDGGPVSRAEIEELHRIDRMRSPDEVTRARTDDGVKDATIFAAVIGRGFDLNQLPVTKALFQVVRNEEKAAADRAKAHFLRNRPWIVDSSLKPCSTNDDPRSSYPSGHTTMGYAMGAILARLMPSRAPEIMARAASYARARLICEVHFPSDVTAGQAYGMLVAERLMGQQTFRAAFDASAKELTKAGLAG